MFEIRQSALYHAAGYHAYIIPVPAGFKTILCRRKDESVALICLVGVLVLVKCQTVAHDAERIGAGTHLRTFSALDTEIDVTYACDHHLLRIETSVFQRRTYCGAFSAVDAGPAEAVDLVLQVDHDIGSELYSGTGLDPYIEGMLHQYHFGHQVGIFLEFRSDAPAGENHLDMFRTGFEHINEFNI